MCGWLWGLMLWPVFLLLLVVVYAIIYVDACLNVMRDILRVIALKTID